MTSDLSGIVSELAYQRPDWLIWWSDHTARFWGLGWMLNRPDGRPVLVTGDQPAELLQRMDYLERLYPHHPAPWREPPTTPPSGAPGHVA